MSGRIDEAKGAVKEAAGKVLGNEQLEAEGKAGKTAAKGGRETAGAGNQAVGGLKAKAGDALDNEQMQAEGEAQKLKGKGQSAG